MDDSTKETLEEMRDSLDTISHTQVQQHYTLIDHTRRSAANEARLDIMESFKDTFESHMDKLTGFLGALKWTVGVVSFALIVLQLIPLIKG